jgi:hypothetical protein
VRDGKGEEFAVCVCWGGGGDLDIVFSAYLLLLHFFFFTYMLIRHRCA